MTIASPASVAPIYAAGTRRLEEMIADARRMAYQENYSYTEGWDDNTVSRIFNLGLDRLYAGVTEIDNPANINEVYLDVIAQQTEYQLPIEVHMAIRIMDVRYLYGTQSWEFITLRQGMIQDRFGYPTNIPDTYAIRNGKLILSPAPNLTKLRSLIINFQVRMRSLDVRRGKVASVLSTVGDITAITNFNPAGVTTLAPHGLSTGDKVSISGVVGMEQINGQISTITVTGANSFDLDTVDSTLYGTYVSGGLFFLVPVQFQLNFTPTSQKDVNMQANADSILDKNDWVCFVGRNGEPIVDAVPTASYNTTTFVLTAENTYAFPADEYLNLINTLANGQIPYVVTGDFASTHSALDRQCEDHLIEYCILRLLRLQSAAEPTQIQLDTEDRVLNRLISAYRRYRPSIIPVIWQERLRPRSWPWGRRGMY